MLDDYRQRREWSKEERLSGESGEARREREQATKETAAAELWGGFLGS